MILGSAQLIVLGIFGEYLGRLYLESKRRPLYIIDRILSQGGEEIWKENLKSKIIIIENPLVRKN
jgi:dolichol-phosphate mannosyltransferase